MSLAGAQPGDWKQYKIHGMRTSNNGVEYDVEMRQDRKRQSQWIHSAEVQSHLIRHFNAKSRTERSKKKDVLDIVNERRSLTVFISSDAEDEDDKSVISLSSSSDVVEMGSIPGSCDSLAVTAEQTPRRSSRQRWVSRRISDVPGLAVTELVVPVTAVILIDNSSNVREPAGRSRSSSQPDDSFQFLAMPHNELSDIQLEPSPVRRQTRQSSKVPIPAPAVKACPQKQKQAAVRSSPRKRASQRRQESPGPGNCKSAGKETAARLSLPDGSRRGKQSCDVSNGLSMRRREGVALRKKMPTRKTAGLVKKSNKNKRQSEPLVAAQSERRTSRAPNASSSCVSLLESKFSESETSTQMDADELGMIGLLPHENHVQATSCTPDSDTPAEVAVRNATPKSRSHCNPGIPMSTKRVRTSTTKSGRKSVSTIEDNSFFYEVDAIAGEEADIQQKVRKEESQNRKRNAKPGHTLKQFYLSQADDALASPTPCESRRKLSSFGTTLLWKSDNIENSLQKLKAAGSIPIEIKCRSGENYVVEFSNSQTLRVPIQFLEKYFPDEHKHLMTFKVSRMLPSTPSSSQLFSPYSSPMSPSTPRTASRIAFHLDFSEPPSPVSKTGSSDSRCGTPACSVPNRRDSLMSEVSMTDTEADVHEERREDPDSQAPRPESGPELHEGGDSLQAAPIPNHPPPPGAESASTNGSGSLIPDPREVDIPSESVVSGISSQWSVPNCCGTPPAENLAEPEANGSSHDHENTSSFAECRSSSVVLTNGAGEKSCQGKQESDELWDTIVCHMTKDPLADIGEIQISGKASGLDDEL